MPRPLYEYDDGTTAMLRVKCQECDAHIADVARDEVERRIASGQYVTKAASMSRSQSDGATTHQVRQGIFGVCRTCAGTARVQADNSGSEKAAEAQIIRIREAVALVRERRRDLTLEQAVAAVIEYEFRPNHEADRGFRAYLLGEGAPHDPEVDAKAREFMRQLHGPHVGGAV